MKLLSRKLFPLIIISLSTLFCCTPYVYAYSNEDLNDSAVIPAFPGAEGFGAFSVGGRGLGVRKPKIVIVDTLRDVVADDGKVSLREAVQMKGPRFIIFRVGVEIL